jgi:tripartite-type tricarboxylate transporter receptor subunit TctC
LPDVPTFTEAGYPAVQQASFYGAWFPAGTPRERVELIQREIAATMKTREMQQLAEQSDMSPRGSTPDEFSAFLVSDLAAVQARIKWIGLPPIE